MVVQIEELFNKTDRRTFLRSNNRDVVNNNLVGIEVEAENIAGKVRNKIVSSGLWDIVSDSSLRSNGVEFVSRPLLGQDIVDGLDVIDQTLNGKKDNMFGERTSLHIHINIQDMDIASLLMFIKLYIILEESIFKYIGGDRSECIYCVPLSNYTSDSLLGLNTLFELTSTSQVLNCLHKWSKYHAMNIGSINYLGTIEFRHMGGTANKSIILDWINTLLSLKELARVNRDVDINSAISIFGTSWLTKSIQDSYSNHVSNSKPMELLGYTTDKSIYSGVRLLQSILNVREFNDNSNSMYSCCEDHDIIEPKNRAAALLQWNNSNHVVEGD